MSSTAAPVAFAGSALRGYRHVCAFFSSPEEEYHTLLPFVQDGLARGERAYHVLPAQFKEEHLGRLERAGVDVKEMQRTRQLEVATPQQTYLRHGHFDKNAMLALIQEALKAGTALGFPLTRMIAHAESALEDWASANDRIEYETRLNDVLPSGDLHLRREPPERGHRGRHPPHAPGRHHRRTVAREPVLRTAAEALAGGSGEARPPGRTGMM